MGGANLKTKRNKNFFKDRPKFFILKIIYDPFIFANNRFSKIRSINSNRDPWDGMALCVNIGPKCFPVVSD
jgi:hypothetical protein